VKLPAAVEIVEVGPRDGLQNEPVTVPAAGKVELIASLRAAGIRRFEATSFVSPRWIPQLADAEAVIAALTQDEKVVYGALVPNERGYERARAAGVREVALVISATEGHCRANLNCSVEEQLVKLGGICTRARTDGITVRANISTVFGCPFDGVPTLEQVLHVVSRVAGLGIREITLSDTIGVGNPRQVAEVFDAVRAEHPDVLFGAHFHDTRGLALANVIAALQAGIALFDSSIGGLGGCPYAPGASGNVATEHLVYMLTEMGIETGVSLAGLLQASELAERLVRRDLSTRVQPALLRPTR
jgi:hydroxymethylglutaryl-CoA lyase